MREGDKEWYERVNERLAALTAGQSVQDNRLDDVEDGYVQIGEIDGRLIDIDRKVNELRAVMFPDSLGNGGMYQIVRELKDRREDTREIRKERIKMWTAIAVALISMAGFIFKEWPDISQRWNHNIEELTAPRESGVKVKHRHKHIEPPEEPQEGSD